MTEDEIIQELKAIRLLLSIDKKDDLNNLVGNLSEIQLHLFENLEYNEWMSIPLTEVADDLEVGSTTVSTHRSELVDKGLIEKRGTGKGAEFRLTGLYRAATELGVIEV